MRKTMMFGLAWLALQSPLGVAADGDWSGTGELGLALARGNATSDNLNARFGFLNEDTRWKHSFNVGALRSRGEVVGDFDGDGVAEERLQLTANRYDLAASSALKMSERSYWVGALRHENDDFAPFEHQTTFSIGYGHRFFDGEQGSLSSEIGPGYRRARLADGSSESDAIVRGQLDYKRQLTANTQLGNLLLVESGADNTYLQNDFGVTVAMNERLALKAGIQIRHNSEVGAGIDRTDTLTTLNLVYNIK